MKSISYGNTLIKLKHLLLLVSISYGVTICFDFINTSYFLSIQSSVTLFRFHMVLPLFRFHYGCYFAFDFIWCYFVKSISYGVTLFRFHSSNFASVSSRCYFVSISYGVTRCFDFIGI